MSTDRKLAREEERKATQHESVKGEFREEVNREVAARARRRDPVEETEIDTVARDLKGHAIREVADTEREVERSRRLARTSQVVDYVFFVIYGLIGLSFLLELLGARESAGFKQFLDAVSGPLLAPFQGLMPDPGVGSSRFMVSYLIALLVYGLLHLAARGLLRLLAHRRTEI